MLGLRQPNGHKRRISAREWNVANLRPMDDIKFGSVVRAVRRRRRLRQVDVAVRAGVGQWAVSCVERGDVGRLSLGTIRRICAALEIALPLVPRWRGGELPRLIDRRHAAMVEAISARLLADGWEIVPEFTFNHYGEMGAVDVLAWHPATEILVIVEVKTQFDDLQNMLSAIDRKVRLVPALLTARRGRRSLATGAILVLRDGSTERDFVASHSATFAAAFPARTVEVRHWLARPEVAQPLRGIWFLRPGDHVTTTGNRDTPRRVRKVERSDSAVSDGEIPRRRVS